MYGNETCKLSIAPHFKFALPLPYPRYPLSLPLSPPSSLLPLSTDDELNQKKMKAFTAFSTEGVTFTFYHKIPR